MSTDKRTWAPGDWFYMNYGYSDKLFYVLSVDYSKNSILIGSKDWFVKSAKVCEISRLDSTAHFVESTKRSWIRKLLPFKDLICPFKTPKTL
jgi:hypothetical protein